MEMCVKIAASNNEPSARFHYGPLIRGNTNDHQVLPLMSRFLDRGKICPLFEEECGCSRNGLEWRCTVLSLLTTFWNRGVISTILLYTQFTLKILPGTMQCMLGCSNAMWCSWQHMIHVSSVKLIFTKKVAFNMKINKSFRILLGRRNYSLTRGLQRNSCEILNNICTFFK
jgi:hypothetical protein